MSCRGKAQSVAGVTDAQRAGLALGRPKGTNHRTGYKHREESKRKTSKANKAFWKENPEKALARSVGNRGAGAYNWKGGVARLNASIRQMHEYIAWSKAVRARDGQCTKCGSKEKLEAHHTREFAHVLRDCGVKNRDDARRHAVIIFDVNIGKTPRANRRTDIQEDAAAPASAIRQGCESVA